MTANHMNKNLHCFTDDALGTHDATGIAELIRNKTITAGEALEASISRAEKIEPVIKSIQCADFQRARQLANSNSYQQGCFAGVPSIIKDNNDVQGLPTRHGSLATPATPAKQDGVLVKQLLAQGIVSLGKSTMPEFGLSCSVEPAHGEPSRNPWNTEHSCGGSSGGSAALVAAGVQPIAHANDGGGSTRIPAACCGLVGLKPSRGRLVVNEQAKDLPINIVADGMVTRSVRDTANFYAGAEQYYKNPALSDIGLVTSASNRRLKIGYIIDSVTGSPSDAETRKTAENSVQLLRELGHEVQEASLPVSPQFAEDFTLYWAMLSFSLHRLGRIVVAPSFQGSKVDGLTEGLSKLYQKNIHKTPFFMRRLKQCYHDYAASFSQYDVMLSPVLAHTTAEIGYLDPSQDFEIMMDKLTRYASFTPLNNASGGPAISLPMGHSANNLPIGMQFAANHGDERTLLELAFELEEAQPWKRIYS